MLLKIAPIARTVAARNYAAAASAKRDPIQELFLNKAKEYYSKKASSKTGLVDPTPAMQKNLQDEIAKVTKTYGASATNAFPAFNFSEPTLESVEQDMLEVKH